MTDKYNQTLWDDFELIEKQTEIDEKAKFYLKAYKQACSPSLEDKKKRVIILKIINLMKMNESKFDSKSRNLICEWASQLRKLSFIYNDSKLKEAFLSLLKQYNIYNHEDTTEISYIKKTMKFLGKIFSNEL